MFLAILLAGFGGGLALGRCHGRVHRNQIARSQRLFAALNHDVRKEFVQCLGLRAVRIGGSDTGEDATQHPTRTVHADDSGVYGLAALDVDRQLQLGAKHAFDLGCSLVGLNQISAHIIPEPQGLGSCERFDFQAGLAIGDGGTKHLLGGAVGLDAQFDVLHERQIVGTQIQIVIVVGHFFVVHIPRTAFLATAHVLAGKFRQYGFSAFRLCCGVCSLGSHLVLVDRLYGRLGFLLVLLLAESEQSHDSSFRITVATLLTLALRLRES